MTAHGRPPPTLSMALAALAAVTAGDRPAWCSRALWGLMCGCVVQARRELREVHPTLPSAERWETNGMTRVLGAGRSTFARWRKRGGWLA
jgi:hypothetical protein